MARQKRKRKSPAVYSDMGPDERRRHGPVYTQFVAAGMESTANRTNALAEPIDDPIHRYRKQRTITTRQKDAAMAYRTLDDKAIKRPSVIGGYGERITGGSPDIFMVSSEKNYERLKDADRAMGVHCNTVKTAVVFERDLLRAQIPGLREGLDRLIKHFGI